MYTTNYDLLLYWASLVHDAFVFQDGFGRQPDTDEEYCVFLPVGSSERVIYFLHGALHLYTAAGEVRKMVWNTTGVPLIEQIKDSLDNRRYPLVVSEGSSTSKLERIESSSYLSYCARKFENIQGNLFTYGTSISSQDSHIANWIVSNTTLSRLFVGVYGDPNSSDVLDLMRRAHDLARQRTEVLMGGHGIRRFRKLHLDVHFFDSSTANVW